jgi:hypothetical protein
MTELDQVAEEQAALRRVATLVAEGAPPGELFAAVGDEIAAVLGVSSASVSRFLADGHSVVLASLNHPGFPVGSRWRPDEGTLNASILETARPVRIDQSAMSGPIAVASRISDVASVVGAPIIVEGSVWGMVAVGRQHSDEPLPADTEVRLTSFTELVATAISNTEARDSERRLTQEQAALRRVATLVAESAPPERLFSAVAAEVALVLGVSGAEVDRYEPDGTAVMMAVWRDQAWAVVDSVLHVGMRWPPEPGSLTATIQRTGGAARIDDFERRCSYQLIASTFLAQRHGRFARGCGSPVESSSGGSRYWSQPIVSDLPERPVVQQRALSTAAWGTAAP